VPSEYSEPSVGITITIKLVHNGQVAFEHRSTTPPQAIPQKLEPEREPEFEESLLPQETSVLSPGLAAPLPT
jgi:hypothetical protein